MIGVGVLVFSFVVFAAALYTGNTMQRECKTLSNLPYIYCEKHLFCIVTGLR